MTILDTIVEQKIREVAALPDRVIAAGDLRDAMLERGERRDFAAALRRPRTNSKLSSSRGNEAPASQSPIANDQSPINSEPSHVGCYGSESDSVALIAEVKKASPSAGLICKDFDPIRIAKEYEAAGASCLSVLTDERFFQGSLDYLRQIRAAVKLPLLRKDFIIDERQILEAIEWGADAILLIVAMLDDARLRRFHSLALEAGLAALVEVHDEAELDRALAIGAELIGVNNRDLKTFKVDLATTERLAAKLVDGRKSIADGRNTSLVQPSSLVPHPSPLSPQPSPLLIAESGIHTRADVERLAKCGAGAILVGESLMKGGDIAAKVRELLGG